MMATITLYPTNWLYNASVIGFLEVIAFGEGSTVVEKWLKDDGSVEIDSRVFDSVQIGSRGFPISLKYYVEYLTQNEDENEIKNRNRYENRYSDLTAVLGDWGYRYARAMNKLFATNKPCQNLIQREDWQTFSFPDFVSSIPSVINRSANSICGVCSNYSSDVNFPYLSKNTIRRLKQFSEMHIHSLSLGPSRGEFPNAFWNMSHSFTICPLCTYLITHHYIPFVSIKDGDIFINHSSFKVMWYLNKFVKNVLGKSNAYKLDQILGLTILEFAQKVFMTLGIWSIMNIEMVIKKKDAIDYYSLPLYVMKVLLNKKVANLLNDIGEPSIFEMVISGNFDSLVELNHEVLKSVFDDNFERNKKRYKYVSRLKNTNKRNMQKISAILPELYAQIDSILKLREVKI